MINAFTVDVEDYFHVSAFDGVFSPDDWDACQSRVVGNTSRMLDLLDAANVKATFFMLGWVAERHNALVQMIAQRGHEIASHGYMHQRIYTQTPEEFRADIRRASALLSDLTGHPTTAYRAPSFSITAKTPWAQEILVEEGISIDSSIQAVRHDLYGMPDAPPTLHRVETPSGPLWEFPPPVARVLGLNLAVGGGGYFRLYPLALTKRSLRGYLRRHPGHPFVFYIHPWEIDPDQPRVANAPWKSRFRHYVNLSSTATKLQRLMTEFPFAPIGEVIDAFVTSVDSNDHTVQTSYVPDRTEAQ